MTHPLHHPQAKSSRYRAKKGEPFDPDDLTRRLTAHLLEQKAKQERRRAARASQDAAALQQAGGAIYHHVPKVAAAAFERTTTPEAMRQVHKLSQPVVRQLEESEERKGATSEGGFVSSLQKRQALDQAVLERERLRNRNQWQRGNKMEEAAEVDADRDVFKKPTRTFSEFPHLATMGGRGGGHGERPLSTGDVCCDEQDQDGAALTKPRTKVVIQGRNDWEQLDDERDGKRTIMERAGLRKMDSIWTLKGKKEKAAGRRDKDEAVAGVGNSDSPPQSENKSRKNSFLARFAIKRQPS